MIVYAVCQKILRLPTMGAKKAQASFY